MLTWGPPGIIFKTGTSKSHIGKHWNFANLTHGHIYWYHRDRMVWVVKLVWLVMLVRVLWLYRVLRLVRVVRLVRASVRVLRVAWLVWMVRLLVIFSKISKKF